MSNLGTLDFSVKLKDETAKQAEEIKRNLLAKLQLDFDKDSYKQMVSNIRAELSKEVFNVKIEANIEDARRAVKDSITNVGKSLSNMEIDLSGLQGSAGMSRDIIELERNIHALTQDVEEYRKAWIEAAREHGRTSSEAKAALKIYDDERQKLEDMKNALFAMKKDRQEYNLATREQAKSEREAAKSAKESEKAQKAAAKAEEERAKTHVRLNGELMSGVRVSADLKEAFTSLYSVHMLKEFLSNVIEIGGQLEKQRVSMGAILGDTAKANTLFEQIKGLAVKSPFGVVELDQYTKQLAAYGFEYNELYDMIKRLADISAGAGQDISRLTLALGHVRSQTYLTGYTMRQFSMNNIPMLKMLSEYYSELEGTMVSTAEVQERISKKQVSYEDVIAQIRRLTDEGGMFYNMQEKISETLAAKFKNLRDAFSIMYGELAESEVGDMLKGIASGLTSMAKEWRLMLNLISSASVVFGVARVSTMLLNSALLYQQKTIERNAIAMDKNAIATSKYTVAQLRLMAGIGRFNLVLRMVGSALQKVMLSPALWWMIGIEAAVALYTHFSEKAREAEDRMEGVYNTVQEGYKNLNKYADKLRDVDLGKMSDDDFTVGMSELVQAVKDYAPNSAQILKDVEAAESLKDKYRLLRDEVLLLSEAYEQMSGIGNMLNAANESTDGWLDDSFLENVKDYQEAIEKTDKNMNNLLQHQALLSQAILFAASTDGIFAQAINGKSVKEQIELLNEFPKAWDDVQNYLLGKSYKAYGQFNTYFKDFRTKFHDAKETMQDDLDSFVQSFDNIAKSTWGEDWKDDAMRVQSVMQAMKVWFEQSNVPIERTKELMDLIFNKKWQLNIEFGAAGDSSSPFGNGEEDDKKEDEFLKSIQKRIKATQDARKEYEALLKLGLSSEDALGKIAFFGVADSDVIDYKKAIQNLSKQLGSGTSERKDYQKELAKYLLGIDKEVMQEQIDQSKEALKTAVKEIDNYIKEQGSKFNLYKSLLESTGDENFARNAFKDGQVWDEYAEGLRDKLKEISGIAVNNWHMEDSLAEEIFGKDTPALKLYQEIVGQIGKNYTNALESAASAMSELQTTEEKIAALQRKINEWEGDTSGIIDHTAEIEAAKKKIEELKQSLFSTLPVYEQIFGDTAYRSIASIKEGIRQMNEIIANATETKDSNGKANGVVSSYVDSNGVKQEVSLTISEFRRVKEQGDKLFNAWKDKNAFSAVVEAFKNLRKVLKDPESSPEDKAKGWAELTSSIASCADVVGGLADSFADMFDKLGNEGMASAMDDVQAGMSTISNIGKGFAEGGVFGGAIAAAGEVANWIGRIADKHDKKLDKSIQKSQREVKKLQNAYKNLEWEIGRQLTGITESQTRQLMESLKKQKEELEKQRADEAKKKKKDADKLIDYDQQIAELKQQIAEFYEELANQMYGIDIDGWAGQIADAITDAFAKGEDAAAAFNDTVADIMNNVAKNIIKIGVIEPAMKELQDFLFGANGIATLNSDGYAQITAKEAQSLIKQLDNLRGKIDDGRTVYEAIADAMKSLGIDTGGSDGSSKGGTLSKNAQNLSEETGSLLASYLNAVRADVSVIRSILESTGGGESNPIAQAQLVQLEAISQNTYRTAQNTEAINDIYSILQRNINGVSPFHVK